MRSYDCLHRECYQRVGEKHFGDIHSSFTLLSLFKVSFLYEVFKTKVNVQSSRDERWYLKFRFSFIASIFCNLESLLQRSNDYLNIELDTGTFFLKLFHKFPAASECNYCQLKRNIFPFENSASLNQALLQISQNRLSVTFACRPLW